MDADLALFCELKTQSQPWGCSLSGSGAHFGGGPFRLTGFKNVHMLLCLVHVLHGIIPSHYGLSPQLVVAHLKGAHLNFASMTLIARSAD